MKVTLVKVLALITALMLVAIGCQKDDNDNDNPAPQQQPQQNPNAERIQQLKQQILQIANQPTDRYDVDDNRPEVQRQIIPLVQQLDKLQTEKYSKDQLQQSLQGSWRQVWSNMKEQGAQSGQGALADHVYQVVLPDGILYNIALTEENATTGATSIAPAPMQQQTLFLRARYTLLEDTLSFIYDKAVFMAQFPAQGTDLMQLAQQAQQGAFDQNVKQFRAGMTPIGHTAILEEIYVDQDFRVSRVRQPRELLPKPLATNNNNNNNTATNESRVKADSEIFIFQKSPTIGAIEANTGTGGNTGNTGGNTGGGTGNP